MPTTASNMDPPNTVPAAACEEDMDKPTKEYLSSLTKAQLQKRCSSIGLTNVWANKDQLVDMIIAHHNDVTPSCNDQVSPSPGNIQSESDNIVPHNEQINVEPQQSESDSANSIDNSTNRKNNDSEKSITKSEIKKLFDMLEKKDREMKETNEEIKENEHEP